MPLQFAVLQFAVLQCYSLQCYSLQCYSEIYTPFFVKAWAYIIGFLIAGPWLGGGVGPPNIFVNIHVWVRLPTCELEIEM